MITQQAFRVGQRVKCVKTAYYFFGQCKDDRIFRGEERIIEAVEDDGRVFTVEDPERYGPWDAECFKLIPEKLTKTQLLKRIDGLPAYGTSDVDKAMLRAIADKMKPRQRFEI